MKKLTIQQFAQTIRKKYPSKYDGISDNDLVFKWLKTYNGDAKYIEPTELAKLGYELGKGEVKKGTDYIKDKTKDLTPTDSTVKIVKDKLTDLVDKTKTTLNPSPQEKTTPPEEKTITTNYVTKYPSTQNPKKAFNWKPCDENTYPWIYGCKNTKIGQMNLSLFGDRYGDIFGDELMNALESYGYFGGPNEKNGQISKTIYDKVTVRDAQQQNESANKKVVKETVKKVLKERLNKK